MSGWLVVWLVLALVTTAALIAVLIGLVRHVLVLGRTLRRLQEEISPVAEEISRAARRPRRSGRG